MYSGVCQQRILQHGFVLLFLFGQCEAFCFHLSSKNTESDTYKTRNFTDQRHDPKQNLTAFHTEPDTERRSDRHDDADDKVGGCKVVLKGLLHHLKKHRKEAFEPLPHKAQSFAKCGNAARYQNNRQNNNYKYQFFFHILF